MTDHTFRIPYTVALTGGIASGKSTVSHWFSEQGVYVIDADLIARQLTQTDQPAFAEIVAYFGQQVVLPTGELDRRALKARIFQHPEDKRWLESCLHPQIKQAMYQHLLDYVTAPPQSSAVASSSGSPFPNSFTRSYVLLVIPLLRETGIPSYVDRVLVVDCAVETQLKRLLQRDHLDENLAIRMIQQQASRADRLAIADDVIHNELTMSRHGLAEQGYYLHRQYEQQHYQRIVSDYV